MVTALKGDVVVVPFPFSDLTQSKRRPALVLAELTGQDLILCMITSQATGDPHAIELTTADFASGTLPVDSHIRPSRLFTADQSLILRTAGSVSATKLSEVYSVLQSLFQA